MPEFARIYNFACWITQSRPAADNLVRETYAKALKGLSTYQRGANFRAWIYRILRHTFLTTQAGLRAASNVTVQGESSYDAPEQSRALPPPLLARIDRDRMRGCLEELPMNLREVLLLCDLEELTYKEIAQTLGIPAGSVMARLAQARSTLRTLLAAPRPIPAPPPPVEEIPEAPEEEPAEKNHSESDGGEEDEDEGGPQ